MGEHQGLHPGPSRGGRSLLHRGVIVQDVGESLHGHLLDKILADRRVHQRVGSAGQSVESAAGHRIPGQHDRCPVVLDAKGDRGFHRSVIRGSGDDPHAPVVEHLTRRVLRHHDLRWRRDVGVVADAIGDVGSQCGQGGLDHRPGAGRADDRQRGRA